MGHEKLKKRTFKRRNGMELFAPSQTRELHAIRDNRFDGHITELFHLAVARQDDGTKQVLLIFPKLNSAYAIRTVSELERFRDTLGDMLDQIRRPRMDEL
jgi:hypothetical protein